MTGTLFVALLALSSCGKKGGTPDWDTPGGGTAAAAEAVQPAKPAAPAPAKAPEAPKAAPAAEAPAATVSRETESSTADGLRFMGYNVENWLTMDRYVDRKQLKDSPKPDSEKKAVIQLIVKNHPDVLGICEIGTAGDFAEIQESLKAAGLDLPHTHYTGGSDPTRHLGLLSRYPITSTGKAADMEYQMNGQTYGFNRGVLDATVEAKGKSYRFLGVHLKSKRDVEDGDQEQMRINEAHLLRKHVDSILGADPAARLVVYGDFNDTYPSKALRAVTKGEDDAQHLTPIYLKDSRGEAWTHHWNNQDVYSRIDFIMASQALKKEIDFRSSHIIDDPDWSKASDHRPVLAIFR